MDFIKCKYVLVLSVIILGFGYSANAQEYKVKSDASNPGNSSDVIDYNIPNDMAPGQEQTVSITIINNGILPWTKSENYHLRLYDVSDNSRMLNAWNLSLVELPNTVSPSDKVMFSFNIKAPSTSGIYDFKWAMSQDNDFFGEYINNKISVGADNITGTNVYSGSNSEFINSIVPQTMTAGEKYKITVSLKNIGDDVWDNALTNEFMIGSIVESTDITYPGWNSESVLLSSEMGSGQTSDVEFYVTAPLESGVYHLQWMMKKGDDYFGEKSDKYSVNVINGSSALNETKSYNVSFMEQNVPGVMKFNQIQDISITVSNTGSKTFMVDREQLVLVDANLNPVSINVWNVGYIQLPNDVAPGELVTFKFQIKPTESGWQYFQCNMMTEDGKLFGTPSQSVEVLVSD
ncbi:MAG: NBR1-Ig-like domain-containing protein [Ignavibacteria bacterium]